jgi:hypothetical protein
MLEDPRNLGKFKVLNEDDLRKEKVIAEEVAATVLKRSSIKPPKPSRPVVIGPPRGATERRIQKRAWDKQFEEKKRSGTAMTGSARPSSAPPASRLAAQHTNRFRSKKGDSEAVPVDELKEKYALNLSVIEKLLQEKEEMEKTLIAYQTGAVKFDHGVNDDDELAAPPEYSPADSPPPPAAASNKITAAEAADLFFGGSRSPPKEARGRSVRPRGVSPGGHSRRRSSSGPRLDADGKPLLRSQSYDGRRRSTSAHSRVRASGSGGGGLSMELQADYDR